MNSNDQGRNGELETKRTTLWTDSKVVLLEKESMCKIDKLIKKVIK